MPPRRANVALVNLDTGEVVEPQAKAPHQFEGTGYTLQSKGSCVPLYTLGLSGSEWDTLEYIREHNGAHMYVKVTPATLAAAINIKETAARKGLTRLVKLGLLLKPSERGGAYQLTPIRYWEGAGSTQNTACKSLEPPSVKPDEKSRARAAKAAAPRPPRTRRAPVVNVISALRDDEPADTTPARQAGNVLSVLNGNEQGRPPRPRRATRERTR